MSNQQADVRQHEKKMREAFEKWAVKQTDEHNLPYFIMRNAGGNYFDSSTNDAWKAWQAATLAAEETFNQRLVELTSRIRELEADAKRYRWLRDKSEYGDDFYLSVPFESPRDTFKPHEVDEAIDHALTEHKENHG